MSIVSECIGRLVATGSYRLVEGAVQLADVMKMPPNATPAAYVFVKTEAALQNERMSGGSVLQALERDIAVVSIISNVSDITGAAAGDELETIKATERAALLGYVEIGSEVTPLEYVSGAVVKMASGNVWHESIYAQTLFIEGTGGTDGNTF